MTKKITDLEGRLDAAFKREGLPPQVDTIGRYRMMPAFGKVKANILFCKVVDGDKVEFVTWVVEVKSGARSSGHYFETFREGLRDFLSRIETDGGI